MSWPAIRYEEIMAQVDSIDPVQYGKTRNYLNGAVTRLSPYLSRGIISTRQILEVVLKRGYQPHQIESFMKELAWRDYFQQVWMAKCVEINLDLRYTQPGVLHHQVPEAVVSHSTGIDAIDDAISGLYETGYMHNHARMYVASLCCNLSGAHWLKPARWMYYHLLDADWASNALSWQWVSGSFSSKKYYANQENINKYCHTQQRRTFLDVDYDAFGSMPVPEVLKSRVEPELKTRLPENTVPVLNENLPTCIYNFYNLDAQWLKDMKANRILLLEPDFFHQYPVCDQTMHFVFNLSANIENIQVFVGSFDELHLLLPHQPVHFKEHPTANHYRGIQHNRDWMFEQVRGYYPSFFAWWKQCERQSKYM